MGLKFGFMLIALFSSGAFAKTVTKNIEYKDGDVVMEGVLAYNNSIKKPVPGVLVVHEWKGLNDYAINRAKQLADLGYVAFAADIYGKGVRPKDVKEAGVVAGKFKGDRTLLRRRVELAMDVLKSQTQTDKAKLAAIGYCFGGTTVLELARSGYALNGVVSFHGGLDTPKPEDAKQIKAKVLALHGAIDPNVPQEQVGLFIKEMNDAKVDYQLVEYANAVHGFTNPANGDDNSTGVAYNKEADQRSFTAMQDFFHEIFR